MKKVKMECDIAMARKKGFLPCEKQCKACHACIITKENGEREHLTKIRTGKER